MPLLAALEPGDHIVIGIYLAAMLAMGFSIARRQRSTDDFFVGGRSLPAWAVGISILASVLSTITYLGMPGEMFRSGLGFLTRQLGVPLVLVVVWFLWLPFFMKLRLTSAYEYLERRFNYATRAIAAAFCILLLFGWMAVVVLTASKAMGEIVALDLGWFFGTNDLMGEHGPPHRDADMHALILAIGLFAVLYTTLGGIRAVVWTDVVQFFILIGGAVFTMAYIAWTTDSGIGDWLAAQRSYPHREQVEWFSWDIGNRSTIAFISVGMFFWYACTHGANQIALQRYFSVKSVWAARRSYLVSALANFALAVLLAGVGLSLIYFVGSENRDLPGEADLVAAVPDGASPETARGMTKARIEAQDKAFPQFISEYLPAGLRGLVVAALFAAAMSTIDSGANSVSTIVTVDFFRRLREGRGARVEGPGPEDDPAALLNESPSKCGAELRLARTLTAMMGLIIVAATLFLYHVSKGSDIITLCQKGFNCFLGPLGALFVLGMFSSRATPATVVPAVLAGEVFGVCASYSEELFGLRYSTHLVVPGAWLATIAASHIFAVLLQTNASEGQKTWMWRSVVRSRDGFTPHGCEIDLINESASGDALIEARSRIQ